MVKVSREKEHYRPSGIMRNFALFMVGFLALSGPSVHAASMSVSPDAPAINGIDIANYEAATGSDKWWVSTAAAGYPRGQSFTTGDTEVLLEAITYQVAGSAEPVKTYIIRVGEVNHATATFTEMYSETATQNVSWPTGQYMTWRLDTPVLLDPGTTYGVDVGITGSTTAWQTGIPYLQMSGDEYAGGTRYTSGTTGNGIGDDTMDNMSGDFIFHLDMEHPLRPSPSSGATVNGGNVLLSWQNMIPNTGSAVYVDVWFGTEPASLSKVVSAELNRSTVTVNAPVANTYYWRVDSYLEGSASGTPIEGSEFIFYVIDTDGDGFPDSYEQAHTSPPSGTALNAGDDLDGDTLTNMQENQLGTDPNDPDSDNDTLRDDQELSGAGLRPPTDPTEPDTDGDGLDDGVESNTGTWVSASDTGTDPTDPDTDKDGLSDSTESNSGSYVDESDTGTSPLSANSDGDNAGDWFEVAGSYTDPTDPDDHPPLPYPLPAYDPTPPAADKPVKVFILSGQSNMVGFGTREGDGPGTLNTVVKTEGKFTNLVDTAGNWVANSNVYYRGVVSAIGNGPLYPSSGASGSVFGPEYGFGQVLDYHFDEPVLLIKSSIGNRSLSWDCLAPGSPSFDHADGYTYAGYGQSPKRWLTATESPSPFVWYAGKQYDDFFLDEGDMGPAMPWAIGTTYPSGCQIAHGGVVYNSRSEHTASASDEPGVGGSWATYWSVHSIVNVTDILDNFSTEYPQWAAQGFEIAGFGWWQGHKDGGEQGTGTAGLSAEMYETNLVNLVTSLRDYYEGRYPANTVADAPFVVASVGFGGGAYDVGSSADVIHTAQMAVGDPGQHPAFDGNVASVDTTGYWRDGADSPTTTGYHYNHNAETYLLVGDALGRAMVDMLGPEPEPPLVPGTMSASATPPLVNNEDIANCAAVTGTDKWFTGTAAASAAKGQTFTTGAAAVRFNGVTYRVSPDHKAEPTKTYVVRVGMVSGSTFTEVYSETFSQDFTWNAGEYMTWAFTNPPLLLGNTVYAVDIGMTASTSGWSTGIPYITTTVNEYAGGSLYTSGLSGVGDATLSLNGSSDRTFHLDLERPLGPTFELVAVTPTNNAVDVLIPSELVANFSQDLIAGTGDITIRNLSDAIDTDVPIGDPRVSVSDNLVLIETAGLIDWNKNYAIRIDPGAVENGSGTGFEGITNDTTWSFTTATGDPLLMAVADLKDHINGVTNLSAAAIEAHKQTIDDEKTRFDSSAANVLAVLDLVTTYDGVHGPIWVSGSTKAGGFSRNGEGLVDPDIHGTIYYVMQYIIDEIYGQSGSLVTYETELAGYGFGSHVDFPGAVTDSVVPGETNSVSINGSFDDTFGRTTQRWTDPARKPTGCYLPPGEVATVIVPPALVGQGYKIRVGAHSWDLSDRPQVQRLERCTVLYSIESTATRVANPLGGGIYIEVPMGATAGVVTVQVAGAVRSPYFSAKSFHTTSSNDWVNTERTLGAPWADFQSEKYMMQVPSKWIYALDDAGQLMADWDAAIDVQNDLMGFPRIRGKETMYCQVDVIMRSAVHAPGYPAVNQTDGFPTDEVNPPGYAGSYLVRGPQQYSSIPETEIHEQGHAYFFPKFGGESEVEVNLPYVAVLNQAFGYDFSFALAASRGFEGNPHRTLDNTAVAWMTVFNFSPREVPMASAEKSYQMKGHAKFVDIARLFGWQGLNDFWYYYNSNDTYNVSYPTDDDSKLIQLCKSVGHDIRPLFHFWGLFPQDSVALDAAIEAEGLKPSSKIYNLLQHYKSLVPADNAAFQAFALNWWGRQPSINGLWTEREHARQWDETELFNTGHQQRPNGEVYVEQTAADIQARVQQLIDLYFPDGRPGESDEGYNNWAQEHGISGDATGDEDGDGRSNFYEYALNGDPNSLADKGVEPVLTQEGESFAFIYLQRNDDSNLLYTVETTTDLTSTPWSPIPVAVLSVNETDGAYDEVLHEIPQDDAALFIRLKIMMQ